jgi:hypothetical protein
MPSADIYARCNLTRSSHPNIRFNVIIKVPKAKLEELRQLPENRDQTDNQLLGSPRRTFSPNCTVVERTGFGAPALAGDSMISLEHAGPGRTHSWLDFSADKVAVYEKRKFNAESLINVRSGKRLFGDQQKECQPGSLR